VLLLRLLIHFTTFVILGPNALRFEVVFEMTWFSFVDVSLIIYSGFTAIKRIGGSVCVHAIVGD
jgi:hypothetical protein